MSEEYNPFEPFRPESGYDITPETESAAAEQSVTAEQAAAPVQEPAQEVPVWPGVGAASSESGTGTRSYGQQSGFSDSKAQQRAAAKEAKRQAKEAARARKKEERTARRAAASNTGTGRKIGFTVLLGAVFGIVAAAAFLGIHYAGRAILGDTGHARSAEERESVSEAETGREDGDGSFRFTLPGDTDSGLPENGNADRSDAEAREERSGSGRGSSGTSGLSVEEVVEKAMPSMVSITTSSIEQVRSFFGGQTQQFETQSAGSGVIIDRTEDRLLIVTNEHVTAGSETITVAFCDDSVAAGTRVGENSTEDLAILSVNLADLSEETLNAIRVIELGDSDECRVGQQVIAIGNALGYGQSVSAGIISALNRDFEYENVSHTVMQTDAAINPGNSGGALLNMNGELIGINEAKYATTEVEGIGYAIPISTAQPILDKLMNRSTREKVAEEDAAMIGITCVSIPQEYVSQGYPAGAYVSTVIEGMAADRAGIREGDIITSVDGYSITSADDLVEELQYYHAGDTVEVRISRMYDDRSGFGSLTLKVTLSARSEAPETDDLPGMNETPQEP